ncbi:MAG TPA: alpha/beta hydrolase [Mycobacteriales bacterium]|nr:alpha/beta hydrolase [Mycobacteriales bacterium]
MQARVRATRAAAAALLSLLVAVPATARAATDPPPQDGSAPATSDITTTTGWYTPDQADSITIFEPAATGSYPAVIFVHGGAWGRSQPNSYELDWARGLAQQQGWLVAVIGYPAKVAHEQVVEPDALAEAIAAISHRSDVDINQIALWGESAGGQLALLAAYRDAKALHPVISAVVSISGPTDMRTEYNSFAQTWLHAVTRFEGMTPRAARHAGSKRYALTSPADIVSGLDPPTFQAISRLDRLVPANQVKVLTQRLTRANVTHRSVWLPGDGHSTAIENQQPPGSDYTVQQLAVSFIIASFDQHRVSFD